MAIIKATIVLDTSSVITDLQLIKSIAEYGLQNGIELLVPRETLRELDSIKDKEKLSELGRKARAGIKWISDIFVTQDVDEPQAVRGQKSDETLATTALRNDESILDCALYNLKKTKRLTILMSRDRNLCNRAIVDGLETLDSSVPHITSQLVYQAVAQRTMNEMDLDDWTQPDWSPPPPQENTDRWSPSPQLKSHSPASDLIIDEEMNDELPPPPPRAPAEMPAPLTGGDMQREITKNISQLMDWHLRRSMNDEELACLKYREPPQTAVHISRILKQFSSFFSDFVPRQLQVDFVEAVRRRTVDKDYIMLHVKLLQALSLYSTDYQAVIAKYFNL